MSLFLILDLPDVQACEEELKAEFENEAKSVAMCEASQEDGWHAIETPTAAHPGKVQMLRRLRHPNACSLASRGRNAVQLELPQVSWLAPRSTFRFLVQIPGRVGLKPSKLEQGEPRTL